MVCMLSPPAIIDSCINKVEPVRRPGLSVGLLFLQRFASLTSLRKSNPDFSPCLFLQTILLLFTVDNSHLLIIYVIYCHCKVMFSAVGKDFQWFAVTAKYSGQKTFPLRSRPSMTPDNQAGAGKSRRGPGRRFSRTGWRPLLFRVSRYFKDSTGGAAGIRICGRDI